jgi:putative transposase
MRKRTNPLLSLSSRALIISEFVKIMSQVITAKLKLNLTAEQKALVSQTALAYRDALNYTSQVAFDAGKTSNGAKLQKAVYSELRVRFGLGAQMAGYALSCRRNRLKEQI